MFDLPHRMDAAHELTRIRISSHRLFIFVSLLMASISLSMKAKSEMISCFQAEPNQNPYYLFPGQSCCVCRPHSWSLALQMPSPLFFPLPQQATSLHLQKQETS